MGAPECAQSVLHSRPQSKGGGDGKLPIRLLFESEVVVVQRGGKSLPSLNVSVVLSTGVLAGTITPLTIAACFGADLPRIELLTYC